MPTGYLYGEPEPIELCPYCNTRCYADFVDIGAAYQQCGPHHCTNCGASEIGPNDEPRELSEIEKKCHWYAPGSEPGSSANVIGGKIVDHKTMKDAYQAAWKGNPDYDNPGAVEEWWKKIREK